jgi:hypothetical protein
MTKKEIVKMTFKHYPYTDDWEHQVKVAAESGEWTTNFQFSKRHDSKKIELFKAWCAFYNFDVMFETMPQQHYVFATVSWCPNMIIENKN